MKVQMYIRTAQKEMSHLKEPPTVLLNTKVSPTGAINN